MLTVKALRARSAGSDKWESDGAKRGSGALWARISAGGVALYFRYSHQREKRALPLGAYDEHGINGLTLAQVRGKAGAISKLYQSGVTDLHGHFDRERQAAERARIAAEEAERRAREDAQRGTLRQLLEAYAGHLQRQGKQSVKDVRSIFNKHVLKAASDLAERKACELSVDDFVGLVGRLVEAGKGRTADKLRSYLRAAYQLAVESKTDPAAPMALRTFGISVNPIASIGALSQFNKARDRVLSGPELGAFLKRLDLLRIHAQRDALELCLALGGQRPTQLLRVTPADVDLDANTVTLYDPKGARKQPRQHVVPLTKTAAAIFSRRLENLAEAEPLFSTDKTSRMRIETISVLVSEISTEMVRAKEARESFQLRDVRRTAETMMASLSVSSDVRAEVQSHGLGGVQKRHYDFHEYALEKRAALEKWARHLAALKAGKTATVTPIRRARKHAQHTAD